MGAFTIPDPILPLMNGLPARTDSLVPNRPSRAEIDRAVASASGASTVEAARLQIREFLYNKDIPGVEKALIENEVVSMCSYMRAQAKVSTLWIEFWDGVGAVDGSAVRSSPRPDKEGLATGDAHSTQGAPSVTGATAVTYATNATAETRQAATPATSPGSTPPPRRPSPSKDPRGGKYHRRVPKPSGGFDYVYSEEDYKKRPDAHLSGADVREKYLRERVRSIGSGDPNHTGYRKLAVTFGTGPVARAMFAEGVRPDATVEKGRKVAPAGAGGLGGGSEGTPVGSIAIWGNRVMEKQDDGQWHVIAHVAGLEGERVPSHTVTGLRQALAGKLEALKRLPREQLARIIATLQNGKPDATASSTNATGSTDKTNATAEKDQQAKTNATAKSLDGGRGDNTTPADVDPEELAIGRKVEMEHTSDPNQALEIALDHLTEHPDYYSRMRDAGLLTDEGFYPIRKADAKPVTTITWRGYEIAIEVVGGDTRYPNSKYPQKIPDGWVGYGYFKGVPSIDGDSLDVLVGERPIDMNPVFEAIQQEHPKVVTQQYGLRQQPKILLGFGSLAAATDAFLAMWPREMLVEIRPVPAIELDEALRRILKKPIPPGERDPVPPSEADADDQGDGVDSEAFVG